MASVSSSNNQSFGTLYSCYSKYSQRSGASSRTAGGMGNWREQQLGTYQSRRQSLQQSVAPSESFLIDVQPVGKPHEQLPISTDTFEAGIAVFYARSSRTAFKRTATALAEKYGTDVIGFPIDVRGIVKRATSVPSDSSRGEGGSRKKKHRRCLSCDPTVVQRVVADALKPMRNHYDTQFLFLAERVARRKLVSEEFAARISLSMQCRYSVPMHDKLVMWWVKNVLSQEAVSRTEKNRASENNFSGMNGLQSQDGFMSPRSAFGASNGDAVETGTPVSGRKQAHHAPDSPEPKRISVISTDSTLDTSYDASSPEGMVGKHYVKIGKYIVRANSAGRSAMEQQQHELQQEQLHANSYVSPDLTLVSQTTSSGQSQNSHEGGRVRDTRSATQPHVYAGLRQFNLALQDASTLSTAANSAVGTVAQSPHTNIGSPSDAANMTVFNTTFGGAQDATVAKIPSSTGEHSLSDVVNNTAANRTASDFLKYTPKSHGSMKLPQSPGSPSPLQPTLDLSLTQNRDILANTNVFHRDSHVGGMIVRETFTSNSVAAAELSTNQRIATTVSNREDTGDQDGNDEDNEELTRTVASLHSTIRGLLTGDIPSAAQQFRQNKSLFQPHRRVQRAGDPQPQRPTTVPPSHSGKMSPRQKVSIPQHLARSPRQTPPANPSPREEPADGTSSSTTGLSLKDMVLSSYATRKQ